MKSRIFNPILNRRIFIFSSCDWSFSRSFSPYLTAGYPPSCIGTLNDITSHAHCYTSSTPFSRVAKHLLAKLLIPQRCTMDGMVDLDKRTDGGKAQQEQSDDLRFVGVCGAEVKRQRHTSTTPTSFYGRCCGAWPSRTPLTGCLSTSGDVSSRSRVPRTGNIPLPISVCHISSVQAESRWKISSTVTEAVLRSSVPGLNYPWLIPTFACLQWSYTYDPSVICWHCALLCLFVENKCFVGQQKQPADGFSEWCWHTDNARQLQAF